MRKLTPDEQHALAVLTKHGSYCPPADFPKLSRLLDSLVKKKRATVEMTDDGPRYHAA